MKISMDQTKAVRIALIGGGWLLLLLALWWGLQPETIWRGPEADVFLQMLSDGESHPVLRYAESLQSSAGVPLYATRGIQLGFFLLGLLAFWLIARPMFGLRNTSLIVLVVGSSIGLAIPATQSSFDGLLSGLQLVTFASLLRWMKQDRWWWLALFLLSLLLSIGTATWSGIVFGLALWLLFRLFHPAGKERQNLALLSGVALPCLVFGWWVSRVWPALPMWLAYPQNGNYWFYWIGVLPALPFVVTGCKEVATRWGRVEEKARVAAMLLFAGLLSGGPALLIAFLFVAALQLIAIEKKGYPYWGWLQTSGFVQLLFVLAIAIWLSFPAAVYFGKPGFQAVSSLMGIYWMVTFALVVGLFVRHIPTVRISFFLGPVVFLLLLFGRLAPFLEPYRKPLSELPAICRNNMSRGAPFSLPNNAQYYLQENPHTMAMGRPACLMGKEPARALREGQRIDTILIWKPPMALDTLLVLPSETVLEDQVE